jgi:hypothetical protein
MPSSGLLCLETDWGRGLADAAVWLAKAYQLPGWVPAVGENMPATRAAGRDVHSGQGGLAA